MNTGSVISVEDLSLNWIALCFDTLDIQGPVLIKRTDSIKVDGSSGANGVPGVGPGARGENGQSGRDGKSLDVPQIFFIVRELTFRGVTATPQDAANLVLQFDGYRGGNGGDGGDGVDGAKGNGAVTAWPGCYSGPGWGGNGGDAGAGGASGMPANGGDARPIFFFAPRSTLPVLQAAKISTAGGRGGHLGHAGKPGKPGIGGPAGDGTTMCDAKPERKGRDGTIPPHCGNPDISGRPGSDATCEFSTFTDFEKLNI